MLRIRSPYLLKRLLSLILTVFLVVGSGHAHELKTGGPIRLLGLTIDTKFIAAPSGSQFDQQSVEAITQAVLDSLYGGGYYLARVTTDSAVQTPQGIMLYMSASDGPRVMIRRLDMEGITRSKPGVIEARLPEVSGQPLTPSLIRRLERSANRIRHVQYIRPLEVVLRPGYTEADLVARFREQKPVTFYGGGGYTPDDPAGLLWTVRLTLNNLFGEGRRVAINSARPDRNRAVLDLSYVQPVQFVGRDELSLSLHTRDYRNDFYEFAARAGLASRFSEDFTAEGGLGWKRVEPSNDEPGYSSYTVELGVVRDDTEDRFNPTSGITLATSVAFRHRRYSSDSLATMPEKTAFNDTRTQFEAARYQPIAGNLLIRAAVAYRGVETSEDRIPLSELQLVGGADGLRGYRNEQFATQRDATAVVEPRWRFSNGFAFLFYEGAYLNLPRVGDNGELYRDGYGFGIGLVTESRAAILSLAWGKDAALDQPRLAVELSADL